VHLVGSMCNVTQISSLIKIRPVGAKLFHVDGQTDITKLMVAFRHRANAPKNAVWKKESFATHLPFGLLNQSPSTYRSDLNRSPPTYRADLNRSPPTYRADLNRSPPTYRLDLNRSPSTYRSDLNGRLSHE
jgi:hypothetical protein